MKHQRMIALALAAITIAGLAVLTAAPANAASAACPSGRACVWKDTSYKTAGSGSNYQSFSQYFNTYGYNWSSGHGTINDNVTSLYNNGNFESTCWFEHAYGVGRVFWLPIKTGDGSLANSVGAAPSGFNDVLSSSYFSSYC